MEQLDFLLVFTTRVNRKSQTASQAAQPVCGAKNNKLHLNTELKVSQGLMC